MYINKAKKIVLKIGSSNLVDNNGKLKEKWLKSLVKDIEKLKKIKRICDSIVWRYCFGSKLLKS